MVDFRKHIKDPMAKKKQVVKKGSGQVIAPQDYGELSGGGFQNTTNEDFAVPFLVVLQANSPQVEDEDHPGKVGELYNTVTEERWGTKKGLCLIPCVTEHVYVEWQPRSEGGGFVGTHAIDSEVVKKAKAQSKEFGDYKTEEGNDLVQTYYMYVMLLRDPEQETPPDEFAMIAFTSTKIKVYKRTMQRLRMQKGNPPLFANRLLLTTVQEENSAGKYRNFHFEPALDDLADSLIPAVRDGEPHPILLAGQEFCKQVMSGLARASYETVQQEEKPEGDGTPF